MSTEEMTHGELVRTMGRVEQAVGALNKRVRRLELLGAVGVGLGAAAGTGAANVVGMLIGGGS